MLHGDFNQVAVESLIKNGVKRVGVHLNPLQGSVNDFVRYISENENLVTKLEEAGVVVDYHLHAVGSFMPKITTENSSLFRCNEKGERVSDYNLCPSNKKSLELVEKGAEELARALKQKSQDYYFWTDDDMGGDVRCHCEKCKNLSFSAQNLEIYKAILRGIKKYNPNARLSYLIYGEEEICDKLPKDIFALYAPFKRRHDLPITANENCFYKNRYLELIKTNKNLQVLEYFLSYNYRGFCEDNGRVACDLLFYGENPPKLLTTFAVFPEKDYIQKYGDKSIADYFSIKSCN